MSELAKRNETIGLTLEKMQRAAESITDYMERTISPIDEQAVEASVKGYFGRSGNGFFLNDITRFSTELHDFDAGDQDEYRVGIRENFLGLALGSMVSGMAGVSVMALRFKLQCFMNNHEAIGVRVGRYEKSYFSDRPDVVIGCLPRLFENGPCEYDYILGMSSAINSALEIAANPRNVSRMEKAQQKINEQIKFLSSPEPLTSEYIDFIK